MTPEDALAAARRWGREAKRNVDNATWGCQRNPRSFAILAGLAARQAAHFARVARPDLFRPEEGR